MESINIPLLRQLNHLSFQPIRQQCLNSYVSIYQESGHESTPVEDNWNLLKVASLEAKDKTCGWTKSPARHEESGGAMMVVIVLLRSINYGSGGNRKTQVKRSM